MYNSWAVSLLSLLGPTLAFVPLLPQNVGNQHVQSISSRFPLHPAPMDFSFIPLHMADTQQETTMSIEQVGEELRGHKQAFDERMSKAESVADAEALRREYLGKKGPINAAMSYMRLLSNEDKPKLGAVVNQIKEEVEAVVKERLETLQIREIEIQMEKDRIDVTLPGVSRSLDIGRRHPLSMTMEKAVDIFTRLGYDTVTSCEDSPEIETDYNCFEALNCPKDHPARDMQDTFYLTEDREYLLRTHTSAVQIRQLRNRKPPLRIVAPGRVYRRDDIDATHSLMFHQVEILALEKRGELTLGDLKGTVEYFLKEMLGPNIKVRFRGSYFPFTEPSMEVDVFFRGKWMEVLGCGMVDPNVLEMAGIDPNEYSGFAAGFGVERFAMVIHQIDDLRLFCNSDRRFLQQFPHFYDDGLQSFLSTGETMQFEEDPRTEEVPYPPVSSWEELKAQQQSTNAPAVEPKAATNSEAVGTPTSASPPSDSIDISKLDIRVGVITKAWLHEEADSLFCEEIDIGEGEPRQIASGLRAYYNVEDLVGQRVLVLANLKARKLVGFSSHGMVLCASKDDKVVFVEPPLDAKVGERVMADGFSGEPATENQVLKKKMLDQIFPDLSTNAAGEVTYKNVPLMTSAGSCRTSLTNAKVA
ncbi:hypothetical protein MPSEU_000387400 [Mayamaea pseudoterrestris]|nr:hypothetical protein MPSEU_000387400 [Mayamaea pseudoterrestris]